MNSLPAVLWGQVLKFLAATEIRKCRGVARILTANASNLVRDRLCTRDTGWLWPKEGCPYNLTHVRKVCCGVMLQSLPRFPKLTSFCLRETNINDELFLPNFIRLHSSIETLFLQYDSFRACRFIAEPCRLEPDVWNSIPENALRPDCVKCFKGVALFMFFGDMPSRSHTHHGEGWFSQN
jgi:hypothetical protein